MNMLLATFVIAIAMGSNVQAFSSGKCLDIPSIKNVDFDRYIGDWFEIERFQSWFERNLKCGKATYQKIDDATITVENSGVNIKTGALSSIKGKASVIDNNEQNKLSLLLPIVVGGVTLFENEGKYNIWDTDYDTYALIYSCKSIIPGVLKSETAWVLSRERTLKDETTQYLKGVLGTEGLDLDQFEVVDQEGC